MSRLSASDLVVTIDATTLLDGVSLEVEPGEWVSIIGPNGAGKSTLLRVLVGVLESSGTVSVDGVDLRTLNVRERAQAIAWVPQSPTVPHGMKVIDYVLLGRTPHLHPLAAPKASDVDIAQLRLEELDLVEFADRSVDTLSGGELQRVAIGRALVQDASIILLDEPTSALDLGHQQEVLHLLDRLRHEGDRTIISTMHDLTLAGHFADRLVLLANGMVAAEGTAADVLTANNIGTHYGAEVTVTEHDGSVVVIPKVARHPRTTHRGPT